MQALDEKAAQELWGWEGTRRGSIKRYIKSIKIIGKISKSTEGIN